MQLRESYQKRTGMTTLTRESAEGIEGNEIVFCIELIIIELFLSVNITGQVAKRYRLDAEFLFVTSL